MVELQFEPYTIRPWQPQDRSQATAVIAAVLAEFGLTFEPDGADQDACAVEDHYWQQGGEFWVVETGGAVVGTAGYLPVARGTGAVEIRKMYLLPAVRGQGLGRYLLTQLEARIAQRGFKQIWVETASVLQAAVALYESSGYRPQGEVTTPRCDRIYGKTLMP